MSLGQHFPRDRSAPAHRPGGGWSEGTAARSGASAGTTCGPRGPSPRLPAMRKLPACLDVRFWKAGVPSCPSAVDGRSPRGLSTPETACTTFCSGRGHGSYRALQDREPRETRRASVLTRVNPLQTQVPWACARAHACALTLQKPPAGGTLANKLSFSLPR